MIAVIKKERRPLLAVCILASTYVLVSALVMFSVEPDTFNSFFDAFYWAVVTLTTVGYGDVYPQSDLGRIVSMISSIIGIAIVALPTGIITAGYMGEISKDNNN
ncbi:Cyclic nucleotide-gated potassium channel [bioreactor metagenome]|uniref:Cyclic nucleotide-gated potassium channel n=2 Tax=root TaxID=1 RepID=A0A645GIM4_9ZZZZ